MDKNILVWNTRGVGKAFRKLMIELRKNYNIGFLAILEPRQKGDQAIPLARRLGFGKVEVVETKGFSGGIWCFWDDDLDFVVSMKLSQVLHGTFNKGKSNAWDLSIVYGHPNPSLRKTLWRELDIIKTLGIQKWCVGGM